MSFCYFIMVYLHFTVISNFTFNNISVISWRSVLLVEETRVHRENHWPAASHWQTLSHNIVSKTPRLIGIQTHNVNGDRHWLHKYIILKGKVHFCTRTIHKYLWIRRVCRGDNGMVLALHGYDSMVLDLPDYDGTILELHGYDSMVLDLPGYDGTILELHGYDSMVLDLPCYNGMILESHGYDSMILDLPCYNGMILELHGYDSMVLDLPGYDGMILELHGYDSMVLDLPGYDGMILELHGYDSMVLDLPGYDGMILDLHGYNALVLELHGNDGMILELHLPMKSMPITAEDSSLIPIWVEMCFKIQLYKVCQWFAAGLWCS